MSDYHWQRVEELYHAALELAPGQRAAFLQEMASGNHDLRAEVESLLRHHDPQDILFEKPALAELAGGDEPASRTTPLLEAGAHLGRYRITGFLGSGGMGQVYEASDMRLGRSVAIKTSRSRFSDRFESEARVISSLNHPNVCTLFDVGPDYLVMEFIEGSTLAERMKQGPIALEEALTIARQIAGALESAHEKSIVHRDLKPANVKIRPDGSVKVLDFGLAKASETSVEQTHAWMIIGTAGYMSPEQARGQSVDKRADIWAFGVVLYEMVAGQRLFSRATTADSIQAVLSEEADLTQAPQKVRRLLAACLEKDPRKRLRDIADWERLLEQESAPAVAIQPTRRPVVWMAAFGVAALALFATGAVRLLERTPVAPATHLTLPLPNTVAGVRYLALSPDGRTLLLGITGKDAAGSGLALRSFDSDQIRLLPGTGGAREPFWSPDGKRIAFSELDGKLRIMSAGGGPAEVVFEGSGCGCGGGAWGDGGVILVVDIKHQFERCDAERSRCKPLTDDSTIKRSSPVFLPDGKHFLFSVRAVTPEAEAREGLYVGSLENPIGKRLLPDAGKGIFAHGPGGRGFLLFLRDEALVGQAFDPSALTLSGDVFKIAADVSRDGSLQMMASVAANGVLVYGTGRNVNTQLTWLDRAGNAHSVIGPVRAQHSVALSPRGNRIVVTRGPPGGKDQGMWLREGERDNESRLIAPPISGEAGVWSPDGRMVAFAGEDGNLYRRDVSSGAKEELILKDGFSKKTSDWSRDGRYLLFTTTDPKTNGDIWVLPDPGGIAGATKPYPFQRTAAIESQAVISPDGKWIAYTSNESGSEEIYVRPFPSGPGQWKVSARSGFEPRWRGDGKELFYWTRELAPYHRLMAVSTKVGADGLFAAGEPQPLFEHRIYKWIMTFNFSTYSPAPDGQRFLVLAKPDVQETVHVLSNWTQMFPGKP